METDIMTTKTKAPKKKTPSWVFAELFFEETGITEEETEAKWEETKKKQEEKRKEQEEISEWFLNHPSA
jgi:electron transfer flavoprotein alpha/beta subunit